jgi:hypothetical protein
VGSQGRPKTQFTLEVKVAGHTFETIAILGNYASVQMCTTCNNGTVQINFMNMSIRMCKHQFKHFTAMLNEYPDDYPQANDLNFIGRKDPVK